MFNKNKQNTPPPPPPTHRYYNEMPSFANVYTKDYIDNDQHAIPVNIITQGYIFIWLLA